MVLLSLLASVALAGPPVNPSMYLPNTYRPASATPPSAAPTPKISSNPDDPAAEIMEMRRQMESQMNALNATNPLSDDYGKTPPGGAVAVTGPFAQLQTLMSSPAVKGYLGLFKNPAFSQGMNQVVTSPNRLILLGCEVGVFFFMMIFRAWRHSKTSHWFRKVWINCYCFLLGWVLGVVVVPSIVIGEGYIKTIQGAVELITQELRGAK